jgi:hypothetical protein
MASYLNNCELCLYEYYYLQISSYLVICLSISRSVATLLPSSLFPDQWLPGYLALYFQISGYLAT